MHLNTLRPAAGSKKRPVRVGRGTGCGNGKTCGRGYNGQHSRSGGYQKVGFEGGQMPLQRRLPKYGFKALKALYRTEVKIGVLQGFSEVPITLEALKKANLINQNIRVVKIIAGRETSLSKPLILQGFKVTEQVRKMIEKSGGEVKM
ncbi:MAG: 50S ribosomal protein L15 [Gammaproteobacteria bacterium]|nr:50S ribosomal protein L15 [Gammaproteobacteria bacterium]